MARPVDGVPLTKQERELIWNAAVGLCEVTGGFTRDETKTRSNELVLAVDKILGAKSRQFDFRSQRFSEAMQRVEMLCSANAMETTTLEDVDRWTEVEKFAREMSEKLLE